MHAFYLRGKDIWTWTHNKADHPLLKEIQNLRDQLTEGIGSIQQAKQLLSTWFKNGRFSTTRAYEWMRTKYEKKPWMTLIWRSYIPPKFSFILWLALRGKLNTKDHWLREVEDNMRVFCKSVPESILHLYFSCTFVKAIWYRIRQWMNIQRSMTTLLSSIKWIKKEYRGGLSLQ